MLPEHKRRLISWLAFFLVLPLLVYPAAALIAQFQGIPFGFQDIFVRGDILFLVVVLLATTVDWTVTDLLKTPRSQVDGHWVNYTLFILLLLGLVFYTLVYGWLIAARMPGALPLRDPGSVVKFCIASIIGLPVLCGAQYYHLLRLGRI